VTKISSTSHSKTHTWKNYVAIVVISCPFNWFLEGLKLLWTSGCFEVRWLYFWHNLKCWFTLPLRHPRVRLVCDWTPLCKFSNSIFSITFWRTFSAFLFSRGYDSSCTLRMNAAVLIFLICCPPHNKAVFWTVLTELANKHTKKTQPTQPHVWNLQLSVLFLRRKDTEWWQKTIFCYNNSNLDWSRAAPLTRVTRLLWRFALPSREQRDLADLLEQSVLRMGYKSMHSVSGN